MGRYCKHWLCNRTNDPPVNICMHIGPPRSRNSTPDCAAPISVVAYNIAIVPDEHLKAIGRGVRDG
jgi:hypothetical protein